VNKTSRENGRACGNSTMLNVFKLNVKNPTAFAQQKNS